MKVLIVSVKKKSNCNKYHQTYGHTQSLVSARDFFIHVTLKILRNAKIIAKIFGVFNSTLYLCSVKNLFYVLK